MTSVRYLVGDVLDGLRSLPDGSVDLILSSPPFLALRSYLPPDHPAKQQEMGSEATPGEFIDALLPVIEECRRVLAPHGSLAIELGDTYAGSGGAGGDYLTTGKRAGQPKFTGSAIRDRRFALPRQVGAGWPRGRYADEPDAKLPWKGDRPGWPLDKCLSMVPELLRVTLAYGFNPLSGRRPSAGASATWCAGLGPTRRSGR
jgi:SAM-dependent methyltransferase